MNDNAEDKTKPPLWRRIAHIIVKLLFGAIIPAFSFVASAVLVPVYRWSSERWSEGGSKGWWEMLMGAKVVFIPLVIWAVYCFISTQIIPRKKYYRFEALGLWLGVAVALWSLVFAAFSKQVLSVYADIFVDLPHDLPHFSLRDLWVPLLVFFCILAPLYTPWWYCYSACKVSRALQREPVKDFLFSQLLSSPFVLASIIYANNLYYKLPTQPPECYVVTAAQYGDDNLVEKFNFSGYRNISKQLVIYKAFELNLIQNHPNFHRLLRSVYDRIGPYFSRWIRVEKWRANLFYLLLLPGQLIFSLILYWKVKIKKKL